MSEQSTVKACVITIGDELLIGQVIVTNSAYIAQQLNKIGIWVHRRVAVGDVWDDIWKTLDEESKSAQVLILTGGLGPTADDITKPLLAKYFDGALVLHQPTLNFITHLFENVLKRPMIERNAKQAEVPSTCTVLQNKLGTAPGMYFYKNNVHVFSLPGVPHEMQYLLDHEVVPILQKELKTPSIQSKTLLTGGIGESFLAELIQEFEINLPTYIKLAYLPNFGMVRLRLTGQHNDAAFLENELKNYFNQLKNIVKPYLIVDEDISMPALIAKMLLERNETLGTCESCTGGFIAHSITSMPGSSAYFKGSIIAYSNEIKMSALQVKASTLEENGAVSEATVIEMVKGGLGSLQSDYVIATSGIMGPSGGTATKPVGTVWIAVGNKNKILAEQFRFRFNRKKNIELTSINAFNLLRRLIIHDLEQ